MNEKSDKADSRSEASNNITEQTEHAHEDQTTIPGERSVASVNRIRSIQSRVSSALSMIVFGGLALAGLAWYYSAAWSRSHRPQPQTTQADQRRAEGEMKLPSLGLLPAPDHGRDIVSRLLGPPPPAPPQPTEDPPRRSTAPHATGRTQKTVLERQLDAPVMVRVTSGASSPSATAGKTPSHDVANATASRDVSSERAGPASDLGSSLQGQSSDLSSYLPATSTDTTRVPRILSQRLLLAKGTLLDCTLLSAIDSTLPGFTKCVTATDTWSADGSVVLLERGSQLFGETRGQVEAGKRRLFIVWSEARTPKGIVVPLASPGTDPLGRAGVTGQIDRHFGTRFGSAILVSVIDGVVQGLANSQDRGGVVVNPSGSRDVATEILRDTLRVRPTLRKNQGDRVAVLVARDIDFRGVYALTPK